MGKRLISREREELDERGERRRIGEEKAERRRQERDFSDIVSRSGRTKTGGERHRTGTASRNRGTRRDRVGGFRERRGRRGEETEIFAPGPSAVGVYRCHSERAGSVSAEFDYGMWVAERVATKVKKP